MYEFIIALVVFGFIYLLLYVGERLEHHRWTSGEANVYQVRSKGKTYRVERLD